MKPTHPDEVAALAAVVRVTFTELETHGRAPSADAAAALMLIDAWITGADVSPDRLQAAADASHQERVPFAAREKDRARSWAATAAGNLAWMAKKDRGWKDGCTSIMDAAFQAWPAQMAVLAQDKLSKAALALTQRSKDGDH
jgi:hypothetical protein